MKNWEFLKSSLIAGALLLFITGVNAQESSESVVRTVNDKELQWGPCPEFMPKGCQIAILNGNPARENSDILFKVPANSAIPNHNHTSAERIILLSGEMDITYEGEKTQTLKTGSYAYGPAKKPHIAKCGSAGECILFIAFEEPVDAFAIQK